MTARPHRSTASLSREPVLHELPPLDLFGPSIALHLSVRRDDDGDWRAWLRFIDPDGRTRDTVEIFHGASESDLWQSVQGLSDHHFRALYLSLA
jgi:hypothetical protein